MPNLPTLTVSDTQLARLVAAFTDAAGYKAWLKAALLDEVQRREARRLDEEHNAAKAAVYYLRTVGVRRGLERNRRGWPISRSSRPLLGAA